MELIVERVGLDDEVVIIEFDQTNGQSTLR